MSPCEVILDASTAVGERLWDDAAPERAHRARAALFTPGEVAELCGRRNRGPASAARFWGKVAVRRALLRAGMPPVPVLRLQEIRLQSDRFGRPEVDLPAPAAEWLAGAGLGLDLSLSHAGRRVLAAAVVAP